MIVVPACGELNVDDGWGVIKAQFDFQGMFDATEIEWIIALSDCILDELEDAPDWSWRLCSPEEFPGVVDCEYVGVTIQGMTAYYRYETPGEYRFKPFVLGPLPTEHRLGECNPVVGVLGWRYYEGDQQIDFLLDQPDYLVVGDPTYIAEYP